MRVDHTDIDEIMKRVSKTSNRFQRLVFDTIKNNNNKESDWSVGNIEDFYNISNDTKDIFIDMIGIYFVKDPHMPLHVKEEIIKQNIMNFFSTGEINHHVENYKPWKDVYNEEIKTIYKHHEEKKSKINKNKNKFWGSNISDGAEEKMFNLMHNEGQTNLKLKNIKINILKEDYENFLNSIAKIIISRSRNECEKIIGISKHASDFTDKKGMGINSIDLGDIKNKNTENMKQLKKLKFGK